MSDASFKLLNGLEDVTRHAVADLLYFVSAGDLPRCQGVVKKWSLEARPLLSLTVTLKIHAPQILSSTTGHRNIMAEAEPASLLQVNAPSCCDYDGRTAA